MSAELFLEAIAKAAGMAGKSNCLLVVEQVPAALNILKKLMEEVGLIEKRLNSIEKSLAEIKARISESTLIIVKQHLARDLNFIESTMHPPGGRDLREHIQEACRGNGLHNAVRMLYNNVVRAFGGPSVLDLVFDAYKDKDQGNVEEEVARESALLSVYIFQGIVAHAWVNEGQSPLSQGELKTLKNKMDEVIRKARRVDEEWERKRRERIPWLPYGGNMYFEATRRAGWSDDDIIDNLDMEFLPGT